MGRTREILQDSGMDPLGNKLSIPEGVVDIAKELIPGSKEKDRINLVRTLDKLSGMKQEDGLMLLRDVSMQYELAMEELKEANLGFRKEMETLNKSASEALNELRSKRYAMVSETNAAMGALKDVRQFFLDKDYETERARLENFVELCERLQKLQESGFLDVVSDTMLKLSE